jgi:diacyltrehalose acyltransferase
VIGSQQTFNAIPQRAYDPAIGVGRRPIGLLVRPSVIGDDVIAQWIVALVVTVLSSFMGTPLVAPEGSDAPGDTDLLQTGGAAYWLYPPFTAEPLGVSLYPDAMPQRIDYPGTPFGFIDQAIDIGMRTADRAVKDAAADGSEVVVVGHSEGSMVVDHLQAAYLADPRAPRADQVTFVVYGSPERGLLDLLFPNGTFVPGFGVTSQTPVDSQYDTIVVTGEYDFAADPPDRPWNLLALANAAIGFVTVHHAYAFVDPDTIPDENTTTVINSRGAKITTQLIPSAHLPLTGPVRIVAPRLADRLDEVLRPVIDSAYLRHNAEDPYLSGGRLIDPGSAPVTAKKPNPLHDAVTRVKDRIEKHHGGSDRIKKRTSIKEKVKASVASRKVKNSREHKDS